MSNVCGIFWDIQNIDIPRRSSADFVYSQIKIKILDQYHLIRRDFYVVGGYNTIKHETVRQLEVHGADFEEAGPGKNVADEKIKQRMLGFIDNYNQECTIILITGDNGIGKPLKQFRGNPDFKIFAIRLEHSFGDELEQLADRIFLLKPQSLELVYTRLDYYSALQEIRTYDSSCGFRNKYFLKVTCDQYFPPTVLNELRTKLSHYGGTFAIVTQSDDLWCSFDEIYSANLALDLAGEYKHKSARYYVETNIETPSQEVINLMECAKLSSQPIKYQNVERDTTSRISSTTSALTMRQQSDTNDESCSIS